MAYSSIVSEVMDLIQQAGIGTQGTDLFAGHMVPNPDNVVMVFSSGGGEQDMYLDTQYALIDVWVRDRHSDAGYDKLLRIFEMLHRMGNVQLDRYYLYFMHATSNILDMDRDSQTRKLYKITFRAIYRDTLVVS